MKTWGAISRRDFLKLTALAFGVHLAAIAGSNATAWGETGEPTNTLFLVLDTVSARNMSLYGYPRRTTPHIDRFAEKSIVYHNHHASGNFTTPSTASMLTGAYPWSHRAFHMHGTVIDDFSHKNFFQTSPPGSFRVAYSHNLLVVSLLEQFRDQIELFIPPRRLALADLEYSDLIFPYDYNASFWSESLILRQGGTKQGSLFLSLLYSFYQRMTKNQLFRSHPQYSEIPNLNGVFYDMKDAIDWLIGNWSSMPRPALGYFHFLPPHEPYAPPTGFRGKFNDDYTPVAKPAHFASEGHSDEFLNQQRQSYDEYLSYADAELGRFLKHLELSGSLENTRVIITSDHGELFERGIRGHVTPAVFEPLLHIPLIIREPGNNSRLDIHSLTSCVDFLPTLCQIGGLVIPEWCEGQSLPPYNTQAPERERSIYAVEAKTNVTSRPLRHASIALLEGKHKLIRYFGANNPKAGDELYDLSQDPEEMNNLIFREQDLAQTLSNALGEKLRQVDQPYL